LIILAVAVAAAAAAAAGVVIPNDSCSAIQSTHAEVLMVALQLLKGSRLDF